MRNWLAFLVPLATVVACGGGGAPELDGLGDQVAQVGTELDLDLVGTDPDGDHLTYDVRAADLADLGDRATITESPSGAGVFRWTPLASDLGPHAFDFTVSDGGHDTTVTIQIDVRSAIGAATAPVFRQPLGSGTTLDIAVQSCVDLDIVIEDQDTPTVAIAQEMPLIDGAELTSSGGQAATWHWCPTRAQQLENRYTLVLSADDGDNPKTLKQYLIVLRNGDGEACPGAAPTIQHTPADASTILDLTIDARIADDRGLKDAPLFYYSLTQPANPPDLSHMTQLSMLQITGTATDGEYAADVPNPVAGMAAGTQETLYYVIVADDDDDATGTCDHSTTSPVYQMRVTSTGSGTLGACEPCSADAQCAGDGECLFVGALGSSYCLPSCAGGCGAGYSCSADLCIPDSGSCEMPDAPCADDAWEVNDTRSDASHNPSLAPDLYDLVSCPSTTSTTRANDDWFKVVLAADATIDLEISGGTESDLDLHLYHSDGTVVAASTTYTSDETIMTCLPAATYYVKVNGFGHARNEYLLSLDTAPGSCAQTCADDSHENDDSAATARATTYPTYASTGNQICADDDDWYEVGLFTGEVMTVDLTFTQGSAAGDLDLHLYKAGTDLWPCSPANPATCSVAHGQSATSNEHATFTAPSGCDAGCTYDVVVRGYDHAANAYGISIGIQ